MEVFVCSVTWLISDQYGTSGRSIIGVSSSEWMAQRMCSEHAEASGKNLSMQSYEIKKYTLDEVSK